jgi:hypothetical protein
MRAILQGRFSHRTGCLRSKWLGSEEEGTEKEEKRDSAYGAFKKNA